MPTLLDLSTRNKLNLCFGVLLIAFAASSLVAFINIQQINEASISSRRSLTLATQSERLLTQVLEQTNALRGYVIKGEDDFLKTYRASAQRFDEELASFGSTTTVPEQKAAADRMKNAMLQWRADISDKAIALMHSPETRATAAELTGVKSLGTLRAIQKQMSDKALERVAIRSAEQQTATAWAAIALVAGTTVALALAVLLAFMLGRGVAAPLVAIANAMTRLAGGDQTIVVPAADRRDEVGSMARALLSFKQAAIDKMRVEAEAQAHRQHTEIERQRSASVQAGTAAAQALVVTSLAAGLDHLSNGDLTSNLDEAFGPEYEQLRADFNAAVSKLRSTIQVIAETSTEIRSGAAEVSHASNDLSRRTEAQAASLEETAAALDEITATVRRTAEGAVSARELVGAAKVDAERSGEVVRQAVQAMGGIEQSSRQINQIIGVIDEIAFQTNLLALNAGVEAARAGDAGRGFAVVASEVRELAQRSAKAAKEIKALISASAGQVDHGVSLVKQTGLVLERVVGQVAEITVIVSDIAASAREQATNLDQVNTAINQMDQVTQQNAAMVEQATAASQNLAAQADELGQLVGQFRIDTPMSLATSGNGMRHARAA